MTDSNNKPLATLSATPPVSGLPPLTPMPKAKRTRKVLALHMKPSDNIRWKVVVPVEWELADILNQDAWINVSAKLNRADVLDIFPDDLRWHAEMMVLAVERTGTGAIAKLRMLRSHEFSSKDFEMDAGLTSEYGVKWKGEMARYGVFRKSDGTWVRDGFADTATANLWLAGHIQAMNH